MTVFDASLRLAARSLSEAPGRPAGTNELLIGEVCQCSIPIILQASIRSIHHPWRGLDWRNRLERSVWKGVGVSNQDQVRDMPLMRSPKPAFVDLNKVVFFLRDAARGEVVSCTVSEDALRKLLGAGTSITPLLALFDKHRSQIESIASSLYDRGEKSPQVREADV